MKKYAIIPISFKDYNEYVDQLNDLAKEGWTIGPLIRKYMRSPTVEHTTHDFICEMDSNIINTIKDPIEALKMYMDFYELKQKNLIDIIGDKTLVSKILNKKRKLTLSMIRKLYMNFNISLDILMMDYKIIK